MNLCSIQDKHWACLYAARMLYKVHDCSPRVVAYVVGRTLFVSFTVFGMDVEKLIDSVRSREILYKSNKKCYKDTGKKKRRGRKSLMKLEKA